MRWDEFRRSQNIDDRRGEGGAGAWRGTGALPFRGGRLSIGSIIFLLIICWLLGINPLELIGGSDISTDSGQTDQARYSGSPGEANSRAGTGGSQDQTEQFVAAVLGETEDRWTEIFQGHGQTYKAPTLVLFSGVTRSACGTAQSAMGPFYCPNDQRIYLDTNFFRDIETKLRGCQVGSKTCQFSQAYVIAHEVGHHVQNLLGILARARQQQRNASDSEANRIQVKVELQADCLAGVWANHSEEKWKFIEPGDIEAALQTASAIGDDMLQKRAQGFAVPDSFTHGTSAQRTRWFTTGLKNGTIESCDTFAAAQL
ncbi:MAG TPA: neutral zinc metallopeptidase [Stellaceae bacterium]|nr:neutral zinc metallopeptidase [Stellaceae bacterium]